MELTDAAVKNWVQGLPEAELQSMGWTRDGLLKEALSKIIDGGMDESGALIAAIVFQQVDENTREILFLATLPPFRGAGHMAELLRRFVSAPGSGARVWLECREDNASAIALYTKIGFKESGRRPKYYKDGTTAILFNF